MSILHLTSDNFDAAISEGLSIVDFWASWCGPCNMLAPTIELLAQKLEGEVKVCKVDVDAESELALRYGVMSIPTILTFSDGEMISKRVGVQPIEELESMIPGKKDPGEGA